MQNLYFRFGPSRRLAGPLVLAALVSLSACDSPVEPPEADSFQTARVTAAPDGAHTQNAQALPPRPEPPRFLSRTPHYPAPVVYILYREYLHKHPGLASLSPDDPKYQRYLERRLRQLYPEKGYDGMMKDAVEEARQQRLAWLEYQRQLREWKKAVQIMVCDGTTDWDPETGEPCDTESTDTSDPTIDPSWDGETEHAVPDDSFIPTLQMEVDSLVMTQPEIDHLYYQESLADGTYFEQTDEVIVTSSGTRATLDDLIRAAGEGWTPSSGEVTIRVDPVAVTVVLVDLATIGWKAYRAYRSAERAKQKSAEYFGHLSEADTQRDAYRHIFWNMQMARYVSGYVAKRISDWYEEKNPNQPAPREMDLHNNYVGYEAKYKNFRGHWLWDRWDWQEWAVRVRNYINHPENAEYIEEWKTSAPATIEEAHAREQLVPNWKYIYFRP